MRWDEKEGIEEGQKLSQRQIQDEQNAFHFIPRENAKKQLQTESQGSIQVASSGLVNKLMSRASSPKVNAISLKLPHSSQAEGLIVWEQNFDRDMS